MTERRAPDFDRVREAMRDAEDEPREPPAAAEEIAGGPVGNSDARFVEPSEESEREAREEPEHPGATGSQAEPGASGAGRP